MLTSLKTEDSTVEPMLRVLSTLYTDEGAYIRCVVEIINDVKDPLDDGAGSRSATLEKLRELRGSLVRTTQRCRGPAVGQPWHAHHCAPYRCCLRCRCRTTGGPPAAARRVRGGGGV